MPPFKQVHASDNEKPNAEVVGSADLKETLKERHLVRGSFWINGVEYRDFEARSPGEVVRKINEQSNKHGITASIDDGYHLVLEGDGPGEIAIASGHDADRARVSRAEAERNQNLSEAQRNDIREARKARGEQQDHDDKDILDLLGLKATADYAPGQEGADWAPGESAEQRQKRREDNKARGIMAPQRSIMGGRNPAEDARIAERQGREGGGTTTLNRGPSDTTSQDPHNPPGPRGPYGDQTDHRDDGMGRSPPAGPRPGTTPATTENPSL
jgi:hypothetical protein